MRSFNRIGSALLFFVQLSLSGLAQSGIITTYAGPQLPVNGAQAVTQAIDYPTAVASDGAGGFYVASVNQNRVYRVVADGTLSLVAGTGAVGSSGDGGPATSAQLSYPYGVALDAAGNLFIADTHNNRVRKVTPRGLISTAAGNGTSGYSGDGGPATSAQLLSPYGVAVDAAGNLFIADSGNNRIRKVTPDGVISTIAGNGTYGMNGDGGPATSAQLRGPYAVAVDAAGNVFIADTYNYRVRKVTPDGVINTFTTGGAIGGFFSYVNGDPFGLATDAAGNLFIASTYTDLIIKVTPGGVSSTVAGGGYEKGGFSGDGQAATTALLYEPNGVAVDASGNVFIADTGNNRIRKVTPDGLINTVAGNGTYGFSGDGGPATSAQLWNPYGVAVDTAGNLFIADTFNYRIRKVTPAGVISTVAGNGTDGFSGDGGPATSAQLSGPSGVALDGAGNLFIADTDNNRVRKVTPGGVISTIAGNGILGYNTNFSGDGGPATSAQLFSPYGIAVDAGGSLFIADTGNDRVRKVTPDGVINTVTQSGAEGIALDAAGNLFINENIRISKMTPDGVISTVAGNGTQGFGGDGGPATAAQFQGPSGIAVDTFGNVFIADTGNHRIRKVTPDGVISTVAGIGIYGFSGDGGPATSAQLYWPNGVAVDIAGNLFVADTYNGRIRRVAGASNVSMDLAPSGSATCGTAGVNETIQTGYATVAINSGSAPYGTAVFSFKLNGVTVSEAGVPASPPTTAARIFIDYRSAVAAIPERISAGTVNINTGIAVVNSGSATANLTYTLRDVTGVTLSIGHGTLAAGAHFAKFIDQFSDVAPDFVLPANLQFASLEISSDQPLSILALRMTTNQRNEALFTTTPIADLTRSLSYAPIYFPQFADGGGYTTSLVLLNTSNLTEIGTLQLLNGAGKPLVVNQVGGTSGSVFTYYIPSGGAFRFQTDGSPAATTAGWVQLTPAFGTPTPIGAGVFGYNPGAFLVTESGIPATVSTTHARIYVDMSGGHRTGLAIANPTNANTNVTITAFQNDGVTGIGTSQGPLQISANGYSAFFADQFIAGLPAGFTGVLDIISSTPFAALTVRSLTNERSDFLLATFPVADMIVGAPSPIVFPQIADGGGYVTQFILIGAGGASSVTLNYYGEDGKYLPIGK